MTARPANELAGEDGLIRAEFSRGADRHGHEIILDGVVLMSVEGDDREAWPPSPALRDLTIESRPNGGRVALLVGMAGRSHWSLSVECPRGTSSLVFDAACRASQPVGRLGSEYRLAPHWRGELDANGQGCTLVNHRRPDQVRIEACDHSTWLVLADNSLRIEPRRASTATVRWKYRVRGERRSVEC